MPIRAVIFDWDGVVVDSPPLLPVTDGAAGAVWLMTRL